MSKRFKKTFSDQIRSYDSQSTYFYEQEHLCSEIPGRTLYDDAEEREFTRIFEAPIDTEDPENSLEGIKEEIRVRIRITKQEIFKIGELLYYAKKCCQKQGTKFQEWIESNFDFSYETANNFMNVYKNCLGHINLAMQLNSSILYKISAPSFPDELREYLFERGNFEKITNGKLKEITRKYKEGGFEAVQDDVEEVSRGYTIYKQTQYSLDVVENTLRKLTQQQTKMQCHGGPTTNLIVQFEDKIQDHEKEAQQINEKLNQAFETAIETLEQAKKESEEILENVGEKIKNRCNTKENEGE